MSSQLVRITEGVFKNIEGEIVRIEQFSGSGLMKVDIQVDSENVITVNYDQIEPIEEEYLIYITNIDQYELGKETLAGLYPPYISKMSKYKVDDYIRGVYNEINPRSIKITPYEFELHHNPAKYRVTATPTSKVKTECKINGLDIDVEALSNIIDKLK